MIQEERGSVTEIVADILRPSAGESATISVTGSRK